jgi:hypothetical protein
MIRGSVLGTHIAVYRGQVDDTSYLTLSLYKTIKNLSKRFMMVKTPKQKIKWKEVLPP